MNERGGLIEAVVTILLALMFVGFWAFNFHTQLFSLTTTSTWSGNGTLPNLFLAGTIAIMLFVLFFWGLKDNVRGYSNI